MTVKHIEKQKKEELVGTVELEKMDVESEENSLLEETSSEHSNVIEQLESISGLKLLKFVISNAKGVCKVLSIPENLHLAERLSQEVAKVCRKHVKTEEKAWKFFSKVLSKTEKLSCDSELFKTILKNGLKFTENSQCGGGIVEILQSIFSVGAYLGRVENPTLGIQMIISHSKATDIFLESHKFVKKSNPNPKLQPQGGKPHNNSEEQENKDKEIFSKIKTQLLKLWKNLVVAFTKVSKHDGTENDKKILENSVPYLLQMYTATKSEADIEIFEIFELYTGKKLQISVEGMPLFGPKCFEPAPKGASNPLFAHSTRANTVLNLINDEQAYKTAMEYDEEAAQTANPKHYDFRFLLPLVCHALDSKNICDGKKVISNGWIYIIVRGLSFENHSLRNLSLLAYKLVVQNFQLPKREKGFQQQDIKVWLHFLLSVRKGIQTLGKCKVSNLLSVWMVGAWEAIRQPHHPMYQRLTTFLFAKPVIDLNVLPDFQPFYNATDGNRMTREWILNILSHGLKIKDDWQVAQRNPTINYLCCSFLVETVFLKREILEIFREGARIPEVAQEMVDRHSLLIWMANLPTCGNRNLYMRELLSFYQALRENCPQSESRDFMFKFVAKRLEWSESVFENGDDNDRDQHVDVNE